MELAAAPVRSQTIDRPAVAHGDPSPIVRLLAVVLLVAAFASCTVLTATGLSVDAADFVPFIVMAGTMFALAQWCRWRALDPRLAQAAGIVGLGIVSLILCGILSNAGLALRLPLADARLAASDAAIGFNAGHAIQAVADHPALTASLSAVYNASGIAAVAVILLAVLANSRSKAWELTGTVVIAMQAVAILSPLFPAWGAMRHFSLQQLQGHGLPLGAGVYQWPAFAHFRNAADGVLRLSDMGGVVAFPSFHTVLGLMVAQAWGDTRWRWLGVAWAAGVIASAVPMGGHYVVDLLAGVAVWLTAVSLARRFNIPSA